MSRISRPAFAVWLLVGVVLAPVCVAAQERPVVFLHGLRSSPDAWQGASDRLRQRTMIAPHRPALDWRQSYAQQANALKANSSLAVLPGHTTVAVGHSNGGIVARQWSRTRYLAGIVTLGTPHAGAPLITRFAEWSSYANATSAYVAAVTFAFNRPSPTAWVMGPVSPLLSWAIGFAQSSIVDLAAAVAINAQFPVMADMRPGSTFLTQLNTPSNLNREAVAAPRRAGIVSVAHNYYWAGPMRAAAPDYADAIATTLYGTIATLDFWAAWVLANSPHGDPVAIQQAQSLFSLSAHLASIDPVYCAMVSSVSSNQCLPNDGVLPHTSQRYPNGMNVVVGTDGSYGPVHSRLTQQSDDSLYRLLVEVMQVPVRTSTPPPTSPAPPPPPPPGTTPPADPPPADSPPSGEPPPGATRQDVLLGGETLRPGDHLQSGDGRFELVYQGDGNLVLYQHGSALWHTSTHGTAPGLVAMQHDGNFVVYNVHNVPLWSSGTHGWPGAWLVVQNDGNLVVYSAAGQPLWASHTSR